MSLFETNIHFSQSNRCPKLKSINYMYMVSRTEFSTAAFRFGHSLIRQTFSHSGRGIDVKDIFDAYRTTERFGKLAWTLVLLSW